MKKMFAYCIVVLVILAMSVTAFAETGAFVGSPSASGAPTLDQEHSDEGVKITSYTNREDDLSADEIADFEAAYANVLGSGSVAELTDSIDKVANKLNVSVEGLAVSDLFFVSLEDGVEHKDGDSYTLRLNTNTLGNVVCLMQYVNGQWNIISDFNMIDENTIEISANGVGAYAIIVSTAEVPEYPKGISAWGVVGIVAGAVAVVAGASVAVALSIKKRKSNV